MRPAPCCVSCVFFITVLNTLLYCGHAQDAQLTFEPNLASFFSGESVTFRCDMKEGAVTDWLYRLNHNGRQIASFSTNNLYSLNLMAHSSGKYQCIGHHKSSEDFEKQSNNVTLLVSAHRPKATLRADRKSIPTGSAVTLYCSVDGSAGWTYEWFRSTSNSYEALPGTENHISISQHGLYRCRGSRGKTPAFLTEDSDVLRLEITLPNRASVTIQQKWTQIFSGEEIAVMCEIEGGDAEWKYEWRTDSSNTPPAHREYRIGSASPFHNGKYWCKGRQDLYTSTEWSVAFQLTVLPNKPTPTAVASGLTILAGETLTCSVDNSAEWKYYWFRRPTVFSETEIIKDGGPDTVITVSQGGIYHCRAGRGTPSFFTEDSHVVIIEERVSKKAVLSLEPNWSLIFAGEAITVRCDIDGSAEWEYEWSKPDSNTLPAHGECRISSAAVSHSGNYRCMGKHKSDWYSSTEWSEVVALTVSPHRPKANLSAEDGSFPVGGSVTLTCSVSPSSSGWEYFWYRGHKTSEPLTAQDAALSTSQVSVSRGGLYWCRGGRGNPVYYTEFSDPVSVNAVATNRAVVTLQSNWPKIYSGEAVSLRCDIQGEEAEWEHEWATTSSDKPPNQKEYRISSVSLLNDGEYWCKGRLERSQRGSTAWSSNFSLIVYNDKPKPVLTVSPLWLSSGDSVILNCEVEHPSAGWRFYWYKAVPQMSDSSYTYELLPGSSRGTEQGSYIVHGQTGTAGYVCRAGRGDPVYYTDYSQPEFVFSVDLHSEVSLTLSPDRVQHFTSDHVSLLCEGNSTWWRVMRLMEKPYPSVCSQWGTMIASTCSLLGHLQSGAVYWCESESGEFSNAVNITAAVDIILVSPVHSVAEGEFVSLGCKLRTEQLLSNVTFYKNDKVIQSGDSARLNISAASKSDEGFYKCQHSGSVSSESWLLVRSSSSPSPVPSIVGLVFGILLVLLLPLLLLCWYKKSKATCCNRPVQSQTTNQSSARVQNVHKDENEQQIYSLLHGDICVYDTISCSGITGSGICDDPADSCEYGNMNLDSDS